jgi:hypothetical protein
MKGERHFRQALGGLALTALAALLPYGVRANGASGQGSAPLPILACSASPVPAVLSAQQPAAGACPATPTPQPGSAMAATHPPSSTSAVTASLGTGVNVAFGDPIPLQRAPGPLSSVPAVAGPIAGPPIKTASLSPTEVRTNLLQMVDQGGIFCGPYTGGLAPYMPDPSSLLAGYYHFSKDDACWFHQAEVYRGAILFGHPAIRWDHISSAKLYYRSHLVAVRAADGSSVYGAEYCGFGDQLLIADNSTWWNNPSSGNGDYPLTHVPFDTGASEWLWQWHSSDEMRALPSGSPLSTETLKPAKGTAGIDVTALVQKWQEYPADNNGLIIRNTENESMTTDKAACMTEYGDFRLEITYTES